MPFINPGGSGSGGAPTDATYILKTANGSLGSAQALSTLSTGLMKVTTSTGAITTAGAGDVPTLNQSTTGSAGSLKSTATTGLVTVTGPAAGSTRVATVPDADFTVLYSGGALGTPASGTLTSCTFPTLNQNTTGSAAKWTNARTLAGNSVDGSANVAFANYFISQGTADAGLTNAQFLGALATGIVKNTTTTGVLSIASAGTDYYAPSSTDVAVTDGGTGVSTLTTAYGLLAAGTTATGAVQTLAAGTTGQILVGGGASALPAWGTDIPTAVTIGSGYIYRGSGTDVPVGDGGTGVSTFALNGILYGNAANAIGVTAIGAQGQILTVGASPFVPAWTTATFPATTTANQILYSSGDNVVAGLATGNSGVLVTSGAGVPSIATDIPTAVTIGSKYIYRADGTDLPVGDGGTGKSSWTQYLIPYSDTTTSFSQIAIGSAGQVLTSNGAGAAPSFQAAAGGASPYDATVGSSGADYTDVAAAIAGGKSNLLLITSVTEDSDVTVSTRLNIHIPAGLTYTLGDWQIILSGNETLVITGEGFTSELDMTNATGSSGILQGSDSGDKLYLQNLYIDDNSTTDHAYIVKDVLLFMDSCYIDMGNHLSHFDVTNTGSIISNCTFVGGGAACGRGFNSVSRCVFENIVTTGTWVAGNGLFNSISDCSINNVYIYGVQTWASNSNCNFSNIIQISGDLDITANSYDRYSNMNINSGDIDVGANDYVQFNNCYNIGSIDLTDSGSVGCKINNCSITDAITIAGDKHKIVNSDLLGGVSISSGADDNSIVNSQGGATAGGGALTITVVAGANRTRLIGNMTDVDIVDAGTDSVVRDNKTY